MAGTPVLTEGGYKPIEEVKLGDVVVSRDEATGQTTSKPAVQLFRNHDKQILDVVLDSGSSTEVIGATPEHPFYVEGRGWVVAGDLKPGDQIMSRASGEGHGGALLVKAVNARPETEDTYNFEVADTHAYFVGKLQAWVHNACKGTDLLKNGGKQLDDSTIVGAYGNKFVKQADGSYVKVGTASETEISQAGVTVRPDLGATNKVLSQSQVDDIISTPKGQRSEPSTYMSQAEIDAHLAQFDDGAVRFASADDVAKYGTAGPPNGGIVMPKSEFDNLVREAGGDMRVVEQKLGLDSASLTNGNTVALEIKPQDMNNLRVPSGNEGGANSQWVPGGYTSGGVPEAVMDFSGVPYTPIEF